MKTVCRAAVTLGVVSLGLVFAPQATAQCGGFRPALAAPASWHQQLRPTQPQLLKASFSTVADAGDADSSGNDETAIVGFWHVKFFAKTTPGIPDGTEIDAGYAQWHSDGTEIMNSAGRSPVTGNFCLGVWQRVRDRVFKLNHFAAAYDSTGSHLIGPANIREIVTVDSKQNRFTGIFTIDQYDETGNRLAHVAGTITGERIGVDTPQSSVF